MATPDKDLHETLDLLGTLLAEVSRRVETQGAALDRLTAAVEAQKAKPGASAPPVDLGRVAQVTEEAVRNALRPSLMKLLSILETLTGTKALLRERMRAIDREQAHHGRWRYQPWAVVVGIPLLLVLVLALTVPRAAAYASLTCRATGGTWSPATEHFLSGCTYSADQRAAASSS